MQIGRWVLHLFLSGTRTVVLLKQQKWEKEKKKTSQDSHGFTHNILFKPAFANFRQNAAAPMLSWSKQIFPVLLKPAVCLPSRNYSDTHSHPCRVPVISCLLRAWSQSRTWWTLARSPEWTIGQWIVREARWEGGGGGRRKWVAGTKQSCVFFFLFFLFMQKQSRDTTLSLTRCGSAQMSKKAMLIFSNSSA